MLFGLTPFDPKTFATAAVLFFFVAAIASFLPARRAFAINPATVLRSE